MPDLETLIRHLEVESEALPTFAPPWGNPGPQGEAGARLK